MSNRPQLIQGVLSLVSLIFLPFSASAEVVTLTAPGTVVGDGDGSSANPWMSTGTGSLTLEFDTSSTIPSSATINSVTVRVTGEAIAPSYRGEIDLQVSAPSGSTASWDFGTDLGMPNQGGVFDTGVQAAASLTGSASGLFSLVFSEDYNDAGNDCRIDTVSLVIDYDSGSSNPIAAYLNGVFPTTDPTDGGAQPPATLSGTGAFSDLASLTAVAGLVPYDVNSPLWSDAASKLRWVAVPSDGTRDSPAEQVVFSAETAWTFPAGTVAVKHFELAINENDPTAVRRLETRFLVVTGSDFYGVSYRWRPDGTEADLLPDSASDDVVITQANGSTRTQRWDYPGRADCRQCHNSASGTMLGLKTYQMNGDLLYPGDSSARNQLEAWASAGLFSNPVPPVAGLPRGVNVGDATASLEARVHSYLAANCSNCHYPGNFSNDFDLRFQTPLADAGIIDDLPLYDLGIAGGRIIAPQEATKSLLHFRMETEGVHKMPPIGRNLTDVVAVDAVRDWIMSLNPSGGGDDNPPIANDDDGLTQAGVATAIAAFGNDLDPDGDTFTLSQSTAPANGSTSWAAGGVVTYTPTAGFSGTDQFTYSVIDPGGLVSNLATVTVIVSPSTSSSAVSFSDASSLLPDASDASGVAMGVADMNQDGLDDVVHLDQGRDLYIEYQQPGGGSFVRNSLGTPSSSRAWGMALGDADNNGMPDIVSGGYYDGLHYYRANAQGTGYTKTVLNSPTVFLQAINFADINMDGWLDIFACHDDAHSAKFRNLGTGVMVADTAMMDTTTTAPSDNSGNYGSVWTDYDGDGDLDLYVSKCRSGASSPTDPRRINQLFRNDGSGNYTEVGVAAGLAFGEQSWVADFADIDNDGDLDCFVGNHMAPSFMVRNEGDGTFTDVTSSSGITVTWRVIQSVFRDFNNDGWIDLLLVGAEHGLWLNDRDGTFTEAPNPFSVAQIESAAVGDLNHDGFPDVYAGYASLYNTPSTARPDKMFHSNPNGNGFISIELVGRASNRLASGAWLELHGPWGIQLREVRSGEGYGVTHSFSQRFGMGNVATADKLVVRWPSGSVDTAFDVAANQFLKLEEGGTQVPVLQEPASQVTDGGVAVQLPVLATDPTADALTFSASNLPTGLSIDETTGVISGTTASVPGSFPVTVSVTDGWTSVSASFNWQVNEPDNGPPTVALSTGSASVDGDFVVNVNFSEPVTGLSLSDFTVSNGSGSTLSGAGESYSFSVAPSADGAVTVLLPAASVLDGTGDGNLVSNLLSVTYTAPSGGGIVPDADTIALYRFDGDFTDAWTNGFDLTVAGSVSLAGDVAGFDAIGDTLTVTIPDSFVLPAGGSPLVIDAKIFPRNWLGYGVDNIPVIALVQDWDSGLAIEDKKWGVNPKGPEVLSSGVVATATQWAAAVTPGQWQRMQIVFNGTDKVAFFVEGTKISEASLSPNIGRTSDWLLTLGNFDGEIDEVHLSRALPDTGPDETAPQPVLATSSSAVTGPFQVTVDFGESVTGFDASDVVLSNVTLSGFSPAGDGYQFLLTPVAEGAVTASVPAAVAVDAAGNQSLASNVLAATYTIPEPGGDDDYTPDSDTIALYHMNGSFADASVNGLALSTSGSVGLVNGAARFNAVGDQLSVSIPDSLVLPASGQPLTLEARILPRAWLGWAVENLPIISLYQEWDSHLVVEDLKWGDNPRGPEVRASGGILANAQLWADTVTPGEWHTLRIVFDGASTVTCSVDGVVVSSGAFAPNIGRSSDWTLTLGNFDGDIDEVYVTRSIIVDGPDTTPPTVALTTPSDTVGGGFAVTATFDEPVSGVLQSDFVVSNATLSDLSGSGQNYSITVTPVVAGAVSVQLPAAAAADAAGNDSLASNVLAVTYDDTPPPTGDDEYLVDSDTVALYHLNTNFADVSGNGLNLSATGNVVLSGDNLGWMTSPGGKVARFDASGDALTVSIPDGLLLTDEDGRPLTIEARIYPRAWVGYAVDDLPIVALTQEWDTGLELRDSKWGTAPQGPRVLSAGVPLATATQWATAAPLDAWSLLQIGFDGNGAAQAWVNGQLISSVAIEPNAGRTNDWTLTLGNFRGDIDEVLIHRALPTGGQTTSSSAGASAALVGESLAGSGLSTEQLEMEADPDGDGVPNQMEVALGSDPLAAGDVPQILVTLDDAGRTEVSYPVPDGAQQTPQGYQTVAFDYVIEVSENLVHWTPVKVRELDSVEGANGFRIVRQRIEALDNGLSRFVRVTVISR